MKFGVCVNPVDSPRDFIDLVKHVEAGGFDYFWIADIALLARDATSYLALAAAHTSSIRLGPSVFHPFVRHPGYTANAMTTLDAISGGRGVLGLGVGGGEIVQEIGLQPANMAVFREWILALRRLLGGESVTAEVAQYRFQAARLRFVEPTTPPVYIAATGPKMLSLAGEMGDGAFALVGVHPSCVGFAARQIATGASQAGKALDSFSTGVYAYCALSTARTKALDVCRRGAGVIAMRNRIYAEMAGVPESTLERIQKAATEVGSTFAKGFGDSVPDEVVTRFALAGTPADARRTLEELRSAGIARFDIYLQGPDRQETVRLFAQEVLPFFKD